MGPNISASSGSGKPFEAGEEEGGRGITVHSNYMVVCTQWSVFCVMYVAMSMVQNASENELDPSHQ